MTEVQELRQETVPRVPMVRGPTVTVPTYLLAIAVVAGACA